MIEEASFKSESLHQAHLQSLSFVRNIAAHRLKEEFDVILLTHVPLHRLSNATCGRFDHARSGKLRAGFGIDYQNMLSKETSEDLLQLLDPIRIFSGDDHEQCECDHKCHRGKCTENTVGTFNMLQGTMHPSFGVLHASRRSQTEPLKLAYKACFLPPQFFVYGLYGVLGFLVICIYIVIMPGQHTLQIFRHFPRSSTITLAFVGHYLRELKQTVITLLVHFVLAFSMWVSFNAFLFWRWSSS